MITLDHNEAILFRMLSSFFGEDNVIPHMSVLSVCGGQIEDASLIDWARKSKCLFTIVNGHDEPRLVVEFFSGFHNPFRPEDEEHQRLLKPMLQQASITYLTLSQEEFDEIAASDGRLDFFHWLKDKIEDIYQIPLD